jgi:hypothetical protein
VGIPASRDVRNPFAVEQASELGAALATGLHLSLIAIVALASVLSAVSLMRRLGQARGIERLQLKWIAFAAAAVAVTVIVHALANIFPLGVTGVTATLQQLSFAAFPVAMGIAILRYRLLDIDLLIRRTVLYGALSLCLAMAYITVVIASEWALRSVTDFDSTLAVAASTLVTAALFQPLRAWLQAGVNRRFDRAGYDAAHAIERFGGRLRNDVDLDALSAELQAVVQETMQPAHVSLWLRPTVYMRSIANEGSIVR